MLSKDPFKRLTIDDLLKEDIFCCNLVDDEECKINYDPNHVMYISFYLPKALRYA